MRGYSFFNCFYQFCLKKKFSDAPILAFALQRFAQAMFTPRMSHGYGSSLLFLWRTVLMSIHSVKNVWNITFTSCLTSVTSSCSVANYPAVSERSINWQGSCTHPPRNNSIRSWWARQSKELNNALRFSNWWRVATISRVFQNLSLNGSKEQLRYPRHHSVTTLDSNLHVFWAP